MCQIPVLGKTYVDTTRSSGAEFHDNPRKNKSMKPIRTSILALAAITATIASCNAAVILNSGTDGMSRSDLEIGGGKGVHFVLGNSTALGASASGGYSLNSIDVRLQNTSNAAVTAYTFAVYLDESGSTPIAGSAVASFTSVSVPANTTGIYNLSLVGSYTLLPSQGYFLVATSTRPVASDNFGWMGTGSGITADAGVTGITVGSPVGIFPTGLTQPTPADWTDTNTGIFNDVQINATAVPEPSALLLGSLGVLALLRRKRA